MRALLAFDKFKDSLSASGACAAAGEALRARHPDWIVDACPLSDGGEGFAEILTSAAGGEIRRGEVTGPRGGTISAGLGFVRLTRLPPAVLARLALHISAESAATLAIVELASASGLAHLSAAQRDPWQTHTRGTGELIAAAAETKPVAILIGIGGSATNDLGLGALAALGLEFVTVSGEPVAAPAPSTWAEIAKLRGGVRAGLPPLFIACDVSNPLLGARGCAAVYGPQKGLASGDIARMEIASARMALMLCAHTGRSETSLDLPGAGAAGGFAFGLVAAAGATLVPGFDLVADWLDLDRRIAAADVVITGEGRFDATSLEGKGPGVIAARAKKFGRPVHIFAGSVATPAENRHAISPADWPLEKALRETPRLLREAVQRVFAG